MTTDPFTTLLALMPILFNNNIVPAIAIDVNPIDNANSANDNNLDNGISGITLNINPAATIDVTIINIIAPVLITSL